MAEDWRAGGFGIYLHWPFCAAKCPYCDFNSHVAGNVDEARWTRAFLREIDRYGEALPGRVVSSVYFGGGTPSLMAAETVAAVLERIRARWPAANDLEVTLEANPVSADAARFRAYREAGVNRLSIGVQALNDRDLRRLGRLHDTREALAAVDAAHAAFDRVSFDLIYARQNQTVGDWERELGRALALAPDHLSLYQLTIEPGTAFGDRLRAGKLPGLPDEDRAADMYDVTQGLCDTAGLVAYEVSNHARPGAESRHNMIYWRYGDYVGVGPGAHGRITLNGQKSATETTLDPAAWIAETERGSGEHIRRALDGQEQGAEYLMMGLRLLQGIDLQRFSEISGQQIDETKVASLLDQGLVIARSGRLATTPRGRMLLNAVLRELLA